MTIEYRAARPEEMHDFVRSGAIGFGRPTSDSAIEHEIEERQYDPDLTLCAFEDGILTAKMVTMPLSLYWNGGAVDCAGVTAVTTLPSHRRRGYIRELMVRSFREQRDRGQPVAMLWATMAGIYQRFGYGTASVNCAMTFDPRRLRFVDSIEVPGRTRFIPNDQALSIIKPVYERFAEQRTPMVRRAKAQWARHNHELGRRGDTTLPPLLVAVYEEGAEVLGYLVYDVERPAGWRSGQDQRLVVQEFVWLTSAAHRALIQVLAAYDLAGSVRFPLHAVDDPLFHHVQEPRLLNCTLGDGAMVRVVDLRAALEQRGYDGDGCLSFEVEDEPCPWNSGRWTLTVEQGRACVTPAQEETSLRIPPRALAMLACGTQTATSLARMGLLSADDPRSLRCADHLFETRCAAYCLDRF
jgi:predicted acetyltransferase